MTKTNFDLQKLRVDLEATFGSEGLFRWPREAVEATDLKDQEKDFLVDVGLPSVDGICSFYDPGLEMLQDLLPESGLINSTEKLRLLGDNDSLLFAIDEGSGEVLVVNDDLEMIQFANSSVFQLAGFLREFHQLVFIDSISEGFSLQKLSATIETCRAIDPKAMELLDENIWAVQFDTMQDM